MNENIQVQKGPNFWTVTQIGIAAYAAGPIAGCYFLGNNYRESGQLRNARISYICGFIGSLLLATFFSLMPVMKIPSFLVPLFYTVLIMAIGQNLHKTFIEEKLNEGGKYRSIWWALLLSMCILVIEIPLLFLYGMCLGMME